MEELEQLGLTYNWNSTSVSKNKEILDTSLRDGLQSPSIKQPTLEEKFRFVKLLDKANVDGADIGFPINSEEHKNEVIEIAKYIKEEKFNIKICALARTQPKDIEAVIEVSQKAQVPVEAIVIVGSSKVRHFVESWNLQKVEDWITSSIELAVKNNVTVNFLTEDGTRTDPDTLKKLYTLAIEKGASRITLADTVGSIALEGTRKIVEYMLNEVIKDSGVSLDWHGHNDRDLGTANSLVALEAGANRVHVTTLGIGERAGNASLQSVLLNMQMVGWVDKNLRSLQELSNYSSRIFRFPIPRNSPGIGKYTHCTSVGIHASAITKAKAMGREDLANTVYSGVDARMLGRQTEILVGPLSGKSNVIYVLEKHGINPDNELIAKILEYAQAKNIVLKNSEVVNLANAFKN